MPELPSGGGAAGVPGGACCPGPPKAGTRFSSARRRTWSNWQRTAPWTAGPRGELVRLEADIDLSGTDFTPIPTFGGTFEGQGHTISGLSITGSGNVRGLFRYIQPSGVVRDLSVEGRVDPSDRKNTLGGIAGSNRGLLAGCTFHGTVRGADSIGGLVGINESSGQIVNCTFSGAVTGEHYAGGIAGQNYGAVIQCRNSGASTPRRWMRSWIWTPSTGNS